MKIELHILQNFAPSNLNRDDSGLPKDCEFGGARRARISSQCIKRSIRYSESFSNRISNLTGYRTLLSFDKITEMLMRNFGYPENEASVLSEQILAALKLKLKKENKTEYLYYTDEKELMKLAGMMNQMKEDYIEELKIAANEETNDKNKKKATQSINAVAGKMVKEFLKVNSHRIDSVDIALFGRMLANQPTMKIDAACQVAHAISTNRVSMDFDYFTAVDDLSPDDETGAGMIGNIGYNSSCFYRYAMIDFNQLSKNLYNKKDLALEGTLGFIEGAIEAIPTGKQNSFAAQNPPGFVMVNVKNGSIPVSLANAFERPVTPWKDYTLTEMSMLNLDKYWALTNDAYGIENGFTAFFRINKEIGLEHLSEFEVTGKSKLVEKLNDYLATETGKEQ